MRNCPPPFAAAWSRSVISTGVHLGHQAVIGKALDLARSLGVPAGVMTFEPHPRSVFAPDQPPFRLTPFRIKARLIEAL